jgi:hypothetical protein
MTKKITLILLLLAVSASACSITVSDALQVPAPVMTATTSATSSPEPESPTRQPIIVIADEAVHIRLYPTEHSQHLGYKYHGDRVDAIFCVATSEQELWTCIAQDNDRQCTKWINADYLSHNACTGK